MVVKQKESNSMMESRPVKRPRLWRRLQQDDASATATATSLADLPHEMLVAVLALMPAHDTAIARAVCNSFKVAGDAVLNSALSRLVVRAEAQFREACTEEQLEKVSSGRYKVPLVSHVSWTLAYVTQQARLLRAVCVRYLYARPQSGEWRNHRVSFYGGLVLDEAEQVLLRAAQCRRENYKPLRLLHVGRLRTLVNRWIKHFHSQVEPQLLDASAAGQSPHPGCKVIDLLDCCGNVERHLEISWDDTGEWCSGQGRYVLPDMSLRVEGSGCKPLSARSQRAFHSFFSCLASRSAHQTSPHRRIWQAQLAYRHIEDVKPVEEASLQDHRLMFTVYPRRAFINIGVEPYECVNMGGRNENGGQNWVEQERRNNIQQPPLRLLNVADVVDEEGNIKLGSDGEEDKVVVEVRFTCRRHLAPLCATPPTQHILENFRNTMKRDRQPDMQLRLVLHTTGYPELGHCCFLIQQGSRLRPITTGPCSWFRCGGAEYLQHPPEHGGEIIPIVDN